MKATVTDPHGAVLVHLGSSNFLERFKVYVAHVQEWRTQFQKLESVDLRYDHQVIVNPDSAGGSATQRPENATAQRTHREPADSCAAEESRRSKQNEEAHVNHGKPNREPAHGDRRR